MKKHVNVCNFMKINVNDMHFHMFMYIYAFEGKRTCLIKINKLYHTFYYQN